VTQGDDSLEIGVACCDLEVARGGDGRSINTASLLVVELFDVQGADRGNPVVDGVVAGVLDQE
jgi:hypothetical protein